MSAPADVAATLRGILKSYDRIGFGRRGVLDAEREILRLASTLSEDSHARFRRIVLSWIEEAEAERVAAPLHYNLPEHVQTLAIRLCAGVPIPESLPLLQRLEAEGGLDTGIRRQALLESVQRLRRRASASER
jgi:hypothetical protein